MTDEHQKILLDLQEQVNEFQAKAQDYGEDMGAPYRDAAESLETVISQYETSLPDRE